MTIFGWDMSHFDDPGIGNALDQGINFITHKAGGDKNDSELAGWWSSVKSKRDQALMGFYWVLYPGTPQARADAFIDRLDSQCAGWRDREAFLFADCEKWNNDSGTVPSISEVNQFCDRLVARLPKLRPMGYLPEWVYGDKVAGFKYPIIESAYVSGSGGFKSLYPGDSNSRWKIGGGKTATILQYTSSASIGGQSTCDANAFRGDLQTLKNLVAPGWNVAQKSYPRTSAIGNYTLPVLHYGDDDRDFGGYNGVARAQELLNYTLGESLTVDGNYGDHTKAAVKELMKGGDGKTVDLAVWLKLCGMSAK
jgi:hypothetical protein